MRFPKNMGDRLSTSTAGGRWRPPDYICKPPRVTHPHTTEKKTDDSEKKRVQSKMTASPKRNGRKQRTSPNRHGGTLQSIAPRWAKRRADRDLPIPSTHMRPSRRQPRCTYCKHIFATSIAILMAVSLLGSLVTMFSKELEIMASKVETQNEIMKNSGKHGQKGQHKSNWRSHEGQRRKLASASDRISSTKVGQSLNGEKDHGFFSSTYHSIVSIERLLNALSEAQRGFFTGFTLLNGVYHSNLQPSTYSLAPAVRHVEPESRLGSFQRELHEIYQDLMLGRVHTPLQVPQRDAKTFAPSFGPIADMGHDSRDRASGSVSGHEPFSPSNKIPNDHPVTAQSQPTAVPNILHSYALNVVGDVGSSVTPRKSDILTPTDKRHLVKIQRPQEDSTSTPTQGKLSVGLQKFQPFHVSEATQAQLNVFQNRGPSLPEPVQMWELPKGNALCRIFSVGRLPDGTLVLPKWMQTHAGLLRERCGVKGAIYAIEAKTGQKTFKVDSSILRATLRADVEVDKTNLDRDIFGTTAPRNHMPHFVSDIFLPLVASEALLGSGKRVLRPTTLVPTADVGNQHPLSSVKGLYDIRPSLLIFEETWNRPSSEWVPRLARFFQHPKVGFTLLPAGKERPLKDETKSNKLNINAFRSVVTSNLNIHEPFGLFGANGKNCVFDANGITREPPWKMNGMQENPCRVAITVLTRKGPRALLKLDLLEKRIKLLGASEGIRVNFKVVDFGEISFEEQVRTMQSTNILIATHGAGNANFIFMRPATAVIEVFPFSYKAGPFDSFARIFGLDYKSAMSAPQTDVFKECMNRHEDNDRIKKLAFSRWDQAVQEEKSSPWVHRLDFEKEFGEPGKSEGMTTRRCVRLQELEFNIDAVSRMAVDSGKAQCSAAKYR